MEEKARLEIIGTRLHIFFNDEQWSIEGRSAGSTSITPGSFWFEGTIIKYVDYYGTLREIDTEIVGYNVGNRVEGYFSAAREYWIWRSEEHTSELQSRENLVCRLLLEKKNKTQQDRL